MYELEIITNTKTRKVIEPNGVYFSSCLVFYCTIVILCSDGKLKYIGFSQDIESMIQAKDAIIEAIEGGETTVRVNLW